MTRDQIQQWKTERKKDTSDHVQSVKKAFKLFAHNFDNHPQVKKRMHRETIEFIKKQFGHKDFIPLHEPVFAGNEKKYLNECIDSTYVSYVGKFVREFEIKVQEYTGAKFAIATSNGTVALHSALIIAGVKKDDEVLIPALTFVATANAVAYCHAHPVFVDNNVKTLGIDIAKLRNFLETKTEISNDGYCYNISSGRRIMAVIAMHTFGHPIEIDELKLLADEFNITLIEDAAESVGSRYKDKHTGTFGKMGILSFNGNKTITTGGGGMIITDDEDAAIRARHITTTAKLPHRWEFVHDEVGYNYRMSNISAAIGVAQMEILESVIKSKRELAEQYKEFFENTDIDFYTEGENCFSNYWLNIIMLKDRTSRDSFLQFSNDNGVMTRPAWTLLNKLQMYSGCGSMNLDGAQWLEDRIVSIPSSPRL